MSKYLSLNCCILFVDVIGVCKETFDISFVTKRSSGKELTKRDVQLIDTTAREVSIKV